MADPAADWPRVRLMQLISPSLPVGAFTYSQGIEWAAEAGWIRDADSLAEWLESLFENALSRVDIPILALLYQACLEQDEGVVADLGLRLLACRESDELRTEERNRGRAMTSLLVSLELTDAAAWRESLKLCQAAGFALAASRWGIPVEETALGYAWGWLENQVIAGLKIVPLGQTDGQRVLYRLSGALTASVHHGLALQEHEIGGCSPALAIASSLHETQYTRLFRS